MRGGRFLIPLTLTAISLVGLLVMFEEPACGVPEPWWLLESLLLLFALGVVWTAYDLLLPYVRLFALPLALSLYFAVGVVGWAVAPLLRPGADEHLRMWIPFWLLGVFYSTGVWVTC